MTRRELIEYCLLLPHSYEDYPFEPLESGGAWAVMRHRVNQKGFAHIYIRGGNLCINLKCEPMHAEFLRRAFQGVTPAYHMNKEHWNTVTLGTDVPEEELHRLIANSHALTAPKPKHGKAAAQLAEVYERLLAYYGAPCWWPGETPYEVMVGAVLTQNTAWGNAEKAIANFEGKLAPEYVLGLEWETLTRLIRPAGFFQQKAACLRSVTAWFGRYGYDARTVSALPQKQVREELLRLKGVGRETADAILLYAFGFPTFVVDAYTMRLVKRLPLASGQKYETVKAFFERHLPRSREQFNRFHALIVLNGKTHCSKKPVCGGCPVRVLCKMGKNMKKIKEK